MRWKISIHATHTGRDLRTEQERLQVLEFQFTRPIRAAIAIRQGLVYILVFQFTRPIRAAMLIPIASSSLTISIHATHTGRDHRPSCKTLHQQNFNSRDPYGPRYNPARTQQTPPENFNSRDPYGPRSNDRVKRRFPLFQFTRPIRAAIRVYVAVYLIPMNISIHATHTGRDPVFREE